MLDINLCFQLFALVFVHAPGIPRASSNSTVGISCPFSHFIYHRLLKMDSYVKEFDLVAKVFIGKFLKRFVRFLRGLMQIPDAFFWVSKLFGPTPRILQTARMDDI